MKKGIPFVLVLFIFIFSSSLRASELNRNYLSVDIGEVELNTDSSTQVIPQQLTLMFGHYFDDVGLNSIELGYSDTSKSESLPDSTEMNLKNLFFIAKTRIRLNTRFKLSLGLGISHYTIYAMISSSKLIEAVTQNPVWAGHVGLDYALTSNLVFFVSFNQIFSHNPTLDVTWKNNGTTVSSFKSTPSGFGPFNFTGYGLRYSF